MTDNFYLSIRKVAATYSVFIHPSAQLRNEFPNKASKPVLEEIAVSGTWGWFPITIFLKTPWFHPVTPGLMYLRINSFMLTRRDDSPSSEFYFPGSSWSQILVSSLVCVSGLSYEHWAQVSGEQDGVTQSLPLPEGSTLLPTRLCILLVHSTWSFLQKNNARGIEGKCWAITVDEFLRKETYYFIFLVALQLSIDSVCVCLHVFVSVVTTF